MPGVGPGDRGGGALVAIFTRAAPSPRSWDRTMPRRGLTTSRCFSTPWTTTPPPGRWSSLQRIRRPGAAGPSEWLPLRGAVCPVWANTDRSVRLDYIISMTIVMDQRTVGTPTRISGSGDVRKQRSTGWTASGPAGSRPTTEPTLPPSKRSWTCSWPSPTKRFPKLAPYPIRATEP